MMRTLNVLLLMVLLISACDKSADVGSGTGNAGENNPSNGAIAAPKVTASAKPVHQNSGSSPQADDNPDYEGVAQCASCHQQEYKDWQRSHHDLAMRLPSEETVVGNFDNASFEYFGTESSFYQRDGQYFVRTDGPDGKLTEFPIAYTFGIYPLQQYLIEFPGGRLQALSISWDSRPKEEGGQRWFHLYPDEEIKAGDPLHWTGINQNWNFQCADCHSTNLHKNYDQASQTFATQWSEINVGCESCHGPGRAHVAWAALPESERSGKSDNGLDIHYDGRRQARWAMDSETGIAHIANEVETQTEIPVCAQCHSRRGTQFPGVKPDDHYLDYFHPALLEQNLYHADGQIDDEVYVWGSFLQSKMHAAGVTCSNCHNPHSLELRAKGNDICAQCHLPSKFDTADHHFHPAGSEGAQCVNCHMADNVYMQVDARRDHSFRVPRPDLSDKIGSPNACTGCHTEESNQWAAEFLQEKFGEPDPHYGEILFAARHGYPGVEQPLQALALDESQPEIVRATAVSLMPRYLSRQSAQLLQVIAQGDDALLHLGLAQNLDAIPEQVRPALAIPLLYEDDRVIRTLAANAMAGAPMDPYPDEVGRRFAQGMEEYETSADFNADRPESLVNLAGVRRRQGEVEQAEDLLKQARKIAPYYVPATINLADLYRSTGREQASETLLRGALETSYEKAPLSHALGLSLVRQKKVESAMPYLRDAAESEAAPARYTYVYGIALNSTGEREEAIVYLEQALKRYPGDREILSALASLHREAGNSDIAKQYQSMLP